ncbi:hypothetical protein [Leptolyngbya sp. FACHB-711]|uniref:hypothetical protein n=1 Tax=unclassified Leptolyngbya TaxID=2650499 RepID=UPI0016853124|nr:hypothetical protein [Leptolyngbya sp. FACHB-711]MBD1852885.1 hypothetical protein [Cyanobacteria bacterium FACHB-502]MBD2022952.1 hypothetical protein [Leptolyngbya sp. FACHB-711]
MSQTASESSTLHENSPPKMENGVRLSILAKNLNLVGLQGLAVMQDRVIVPTVDGEIVTVSPIGEVNVLTNLLTAQIGVPFGICAITPPGEQLHTDSGVVVTVSGFDPVHYLVRVSPDGQHETIADMSEISGTYGAPFGVATYNSGFIVAGTTDVIAGDGALFQVSRQGQITNLVSLKQFGNALDVVVQQGQFITLHEKGDLLKISPTGEVVVLVNLIEAGFGIPFKLAAQAENLLVTTNTGHIVRVDPEGKPTAIVELFKPIYSTPLGIAIQGNDLIVSTTNGSLLRLQIDQG